MVGQTGDRRKGTRCLTKNVLQSDSLPHVRKYSKDAELRALHTGEKEGGDGGPVDAREASNHQGDGQALRARRQARARTDARRALRACRLQPQLRGAAAARGGARSGAAAQAPPRPQAKYGAQLLAPLSKVWATLGGICGKRLAAVMARTVSALERHGELELTDEVRAQLLAMSAATIDRLLAARRRRLRLKGMNPPSRAAC